MKDKQVELSNVVKKVKLESTESASTNANIAAAKGSVAAKPTKINAKGASSKATNQSTLTSFFKKA